MTKIAFNNEKVARTTTLALMKRGDFAILLSLPKEIQNWKVGDLLFKNYDGTVTNTVHGDFLRLENLENSIYSNFPTAAVRILEKVEIREVE